MWNVDTEPALINPRLPADGKASYRQDHGMPYWPAYSSISPSARGAYLNWLATGTLDDPAAYIGYVFLFFYGLERRILVDTKSDESALGDILVIEKIIRDLRTVYGDTSPSFSRYSTGLLNLIDARYIPADIGQPPPAQALIGRADDKATHIRMALGMKARTGHPIDSHWALCWARNDPDIALRIAANRCTVEFNQLFAWRFNAKFPKGLSVPENKTPLHISYHPASHGIDLVSDALEIDGRPFPDVMVLKRPKQAIQAIADSCMEDLDAYSRWVGKNPDNRDALPGLALLPKELLRERDSQALKTLISRLDLVASAPNGGLLDVAELFQVWPTVQPDRFSKAETVGLFQLLEALGYGVEPDIRFVGPRLVAGQRVALFKLPPNAQTAPTPEYKEAATLLLLAAQVSQADSVSEAEEQHLEKLIEQRFQLSSPERTRLRAYLRFLLANPIDTAGLKKRMESLSRTDAESIADLLVAVAAADGRIDPAEVKILSQLHRLMGLDEASLHQRLHAVAASSRTTAASPISPTAKPVPKLGPLKTGVVLDLERLRQRQESTNRVAGLLHGIFADAEDIPPAEKRIPSPPELLKVDGLDAAHTAFFLALGVQTDWDRESLSALAAQHQLMPAGALDRLNEIAFERCDTPLLDNDEDTFTLDKDTWETLRHGQAA